jgi:uncharacterized membrane protein (UPF0127 family)
MISLRVKKLAGLTERSVGLLNAKAPYPVFLETRFGIHTFGLKFPIDILVLDANNHVVKIAEQTTPHRIVVWNPKYKKVIELPSGEIRKRSITTGTTIKLIVM